MSKNLLVDRDQATDDEVLQAFDDLFTDRTCVLFDSFGSNDIDLICQRIQYMVRSLGVQWIILTTFPFLSVRQKEMNAGCWMQLAPNFGHWCRTEHWHDHGQPSQQTIR